MAAAAQRKIKNRNATALVWKIQTKTKTNVTLRRRMWTTRTPIGTTVWLMMLKSMWLWKHTFKARHKQDSFHEMLPTLSPRPLTPRVCHIFVFIRGISIVDITIDVTHQLNTLNVIQLFIPQCPKNIKKHCQRHQSNCFQVLYVKSTEQQWKSRSVSDKGRHWLDLGPTINIKKIREQKAYFLPMVVQKIRYVP